jgi:hypothetical protein
MQLETWNGPMASNLGVMVADEANVKIRREPRYWVTMLAGKEQHANGSN